MKKVIQLANNNPEHCITLWKQAYDLRSEYNVVIKTGTTLPWVNEVWGDCKKQLQPTEPTPIDAEFIHFTSGTTGLPKLIARTWDSLFDGIHCNTEYENKVWGCSYPVDRMAGIQVILFCLKNKILPILTNTPKLLSENIEKCIGVSATTAMWRFAINLGCKSEKIKQITLGGDAADYILLNNIKKCFPNARITQTYVSSEAGVICSWSDGFVGIPIETFYRRATIIDNEIVIPNNARTAINFGEVIHTGDIANLDNGRILIVGRKDNIVNVGGWKINLETVEQIIQQNTNAIDCRATGVKNSMLNNYLEINIVSNNIDIFNKQFKEISWPNKAMRPLKINKVNNIQRDEQGKIIRWK